MDYRVQELYHEQKLDDTGTKIVDLNFTDPLSAITLQFQGQNGVTSNLNNYMNDVVTRIELVDGSDVLLSMSLKELQALEAYRTGKTPYMEIDESADAIQRDEVNILFGRYLWDPEYFMDLTKFRNPQLKITTDEDAVRAMGATGFLPGSFKVNIVASIIQEGAKESKGFFMGKEIYNFQTETSGDEYIDMPLDYSYAGMLLHSLTKEKGIDDLISQVKLSCDSDKFIPLYRYTADLIREMKSRYNVLSVPAKLLRANDDTVDLPLYQDLFADIVPMTSGQGIAIDTIGKGYVQPYLFASDGSAVTSASALIARITGRSLHNTLYRSFGHPEDLATIFDPTKWSQIKLTLSQAAVGDMRLCLIQLRPFATK